MVDIHGYTHLALGPKNGCERHALDDERRWVLCAMILMSDLQLIFIVMFWCSVQQCARAMCERAALQHVLVNHILQTLTVHANADAIPAWCPAQSCIPAELLLLALFAFHFTYNCPWAKQSWVINNPTLCNVCPCDLWTLTQYAGMSGNCTLVKQNGNPEFSCDTWLLHRGIFITRPFCVPVSNRTCTACRVYCSISHNVPLHAPLCVS